ncbi:MAG: bifunctional phosphoribosylaminoimidazolecarboxamide formyltransferase/IMP cyclohydrolase, partial [Spirochaetaceae bacterium]|nr:bifunctional phosphoribosylaminoimidazolecarboxamide formyltransferase/IMP cyclohydrolase [Spirochaetaceae bacterium]
MPTALISVYNKTGIVPFAKRIQELGWSILASGGTARALIESGVAVQEVADYTHSPEMLGGRVKTLHPGIHGGILARRTEADLEELEGRGYRPIDMVVANLYPFEKTISDPHCTKADAIEQIDIGGVALIRAAAKNHEWVTLLCDPDDYAPVLAEMEAGGVSQETRRRLAAKGFLRTSRYDAAINAWLEGEESGHKDDTFTLSGQKAQSLRYGENPHQAAELYSFAAGSGPLGGTVLQGKELSYNNILDLDAAWQAVQRFDVPAAVVVKHLSPCGLAEAQSLPDALSMALACDRISAFGGVIAVNRIFDEHCAEAMGSLFAECIAAPEFNAAAREILGRKKNLRLVVPGAEKKREEIRTVLGGFLRQDADDGDPAGTEWKTVSQSVPTDAEVEELQFAWKACLSLKS